MNRFMERMGGLDIRVLPPGGVASDRSGARSIEDIRRFRAKVYGEFSFLPPTGDAGSDDADERSWHVLAVREDEVVGCIRLAVFGPDEAHSMPTQALANSRCQFSKSDEARCLAALTEYTRQWSKVGGALVQAGGLAVARRARTSIVAPALCLAVNALAKLLHGRFGVVFAVDKTGGASLYAKAGCVPLQVGNEELGWISDSFHGDRVLIMCWDPQRVRPELKEVVAALCGLVRAAMPEPEVANA